MCVFPNAVHKLTLNQIKSYCPLIWFHSSIVSLQLRHQKWSGNNYSNKRFYVQYIFFAGGMHLIRAASVYLTTTIEMQTVHACIHLVISKMYKYCNRF